MSRAVVRLALLYSSLIIGCAGIGPELLLSSLKVSGGGSCVLSSGDVFTPSDFLSCTEIDTFNQSPVGSNVGTLNCKFSRGEICRFYNVKTDQLDWRYGKFRTEGPQFEKKFAVSVGRPLGIVPDGGFVFVGEPFPRDPADSAVLRADFKCQRGIGHVKFNFWRSGANIRIQICTGKLTGSYAERFCTNPVDYDLSLPINLPVHAPEKVPFFVELVVSGITSASLLILDNLSYTADLCNSKIITANVVQPPPVVNSVAVIKKSEKLLDACSALTCDFSNSMCNLRRVKDKKSDSSRTHWRLGRGKIGNPHTGIKKVNSGDTTAIKPGFAYVGRDGGNKSISSFFILESPSFTLDKDTLLSFDLYQRSYGLKFKVCFNNLTNCPYSNPPLNKELFWYEGESILMPKSTTKVYFVAAQVKRNRWIALDNVVVNQGLGCKLRQPSISPLLLLGSI